MNKTENKAKNRLISKREALKLQLNDTTPKLIEGAFGGNYSKYRIEGIKGMDVPQGGGAHVKILTEMLVLFLWV